MDVQKSSTDPKQLTEGGTEEEIEGTNLKSRDFFWDSVILYLVSVILALSAVDALTEFIRGSGVACYIEEGGTDDLISYINSFCAGSLPLTEYIPAFIFIHGLAIAIPHYLWSANYGGQFDFFFSVVKSFDRFRESETGKYSQKNVNLVRQLELAFTTYGRNFIFYLYVGKLFLQLIFAMASLVISVIYFTEFDVVFYCPKDNNTDDPFWPITDQATCVFTSLKLLFWIRSVDIFLIVLIILSIFWALWFCVSGHPTELGAKRVARFSFQSGIQSDFYVPSSWYCPRCFSHFITYISLPFTSPMVSTDLDFMLLKLFRTNAGLGRVFKDVQIDLAIQTMIDEDQLAVRLHTSKWNSECEEIDVPSSDLKWDFVASPSSNFETLKPGQITLPDSIRGAVLGLSTLAPTNSGALSITFSPGGYALAFARLFERTGSIHFTEFEREVDEEHNIIEQVVDVKPYLTSIIAVTAPENILATRMELSGEIFQRIKPIWNLVVCGDEETIKTSFIVVGPMNKRQASIVTLFLKQISEPTNMEDGCVLITLQPTRISGRKTGTKLVDLKEQPPKKSGRKTDTEFVGLEKPPQNFKPLPLDVKTSNMTLLQWPPTSKAKDTPLEEESGSTTVDVEQQHTSLNLKCGFVDTTFEIAAYVYQSPENKDKKSGDVTLNKPEGKTEDITKAGDTIQERPPKLLNKDVANQMIEVVSDVEEIPLIDQ